MIYQVMKRKRYSHPGSYNDKERGAELRTSDWHLVWGCSSQEEAFKKATATARADALDPLRKADYYDEFGVLELDLTDMYVRWVKPPFTVDVKYVEKDC